MKNNKLIILRGPSGSGKSTVAKELFSKAPENSVLIEQDHYRFIFKPAGLSEAGKQMVFSDASIALKGGYNVILEGILTTASYTEYIKKLIKNHPKRNYMFYFDISFPETLRRHVTKSNANDWSQADMKKWYKPKDYSKFDFEHIVPEDSSFKQTVGLIKKVTEI